MWALAQSSPFQTRKNYECGMWEEPTGGRDGRSRLSRVLFTLSSALMPIVCSAQASPFQTGATALQTNLLTIMTPVAIILVIGLGIMAMANRIAWGWVIGAIAGIAMAFGAPQIVTWIRGMFGV
jgi:type IV secretion system protein VirB2